MKKAVRGLALILMIIMLAPGLTTRADQVDAVRATHEEFVFNALQVLVKYGFDKCNQNHMVAYFAKRSPAWDIVEKFNGGFYPAFRSCTFSDLTAQNWEVVSETEFNVDVSGVMHMKVDSELSLDFSCGYHFNVRLTDRGYWRVWDFDILPSQEDIAVAERLSALRPDVHFEAVTGKVFRGWLMTIDDPSQLFVGTCEFFGDTCKGLTVGEMSEKYGAFAVVNGGGFSDSMKGGRPYGIVVTQGVERQRHTPNERAFCTIVGLTEDNQMIIGNPTLEEIPALKLRDAVAFAPVLIQNGVEMNLDTRQVHGLYTIRTVVGKDAEGRVMFLIAKGRQGDSLGATTKDTTRLMLAHGAVDAANLDGGTSTALFVNNESIYSGCRYCDSRPLPTAFIVAGQ